MCISEAHIVIDAPRFLPALCNCEHAEFLESIKQQVLCCHAVACQHPNVQLPRCHSVYDYRALRLNSWAAETHACSQACPGRVVDKPVLRWGAPGACPAKSSYAAAGRQCRYSCMAPTTRL